MNTIHFLSCRRIRLLTCRRVRLITAAAAAALFSGCASTPEHYQRTEAGKTVIRTIPSGRQYRTAMTGDYYGNDDAMFSRLFRYLNDHDLKMTVPVVSTVDGATGSMAFWVAADELDKASSGAGDVSIVDLPEQSAAILGMSGAGTKEEFQEGVKKLKAALAAKPEYVIAGDFYITYWDSPLWPDSMRHYEITVPVKKSDNK